MFGVFFSKWFLLHYFCPFSAYSAVLLSPLSKISKKKKIGSKSLDNNMTSKNPFFVLSIIIGPTLRRLTYYSQQPFVSPKIPSPFVGTIGHYGRWE